MAKRTSICKGLVLKCTERTVNPLSAKWQNTTKDISGVFGTDAVSQTQPSGAPR